MTRPSIENRPGTTLTELMVAVTLLAIIMATVLPFVSNARNTWDVARNNMDAVQNGRVLMDHLKVHLSQAVRITTISPASQTLGYIEFQDDTGTTYYYDVDTDGNVEYAAKGADEDLAGPVSQFQFTCYDGNDFNTPITNPSAVRFIQVQATVTNAGAVGQDKLFSTNIYLPVSPAESVYTFDADKGKTPALAQIDSEHYLCAYEGDGEDGWAVLLDVNNSTWLLSQGTALEFDPSKGKTPALARIDAGHYLCAYSSSGDDGWATVLAVNAGTGTITSGTPYEFDSSKGQDPALIQIDDSHYLCVYQGNGDDGWATILTVDTDTWTITQETPLEFDTDKGKAPALAQIDDSHFLCAYQGNGDDGWAVVLATGGDSDLVGHWKLDETSGTTASDASGNNHHGALINMAGNEWTTGVLDGALEFDGNNDYVDCGTPASLDISSAITVEAWVKADSDDATRIVSKHGSGEYGYVLSRRPSTDALWMAISTDGSDWHGSGSSTGDDTCEVDTWYHVVGTYDGENIRIYIDGQEDTDKDYPYSINGSINVSPASTQIGRDNYMGDSYNFNGIIDNVRIYNSALDANEVAALVQTLQYKECSEAKAGSDTTSVNVDIPSSTREGDLLIAAVATDGDTSASLAPPGGEGWTQIELDNRINHVTLGTWWKLAEASESSSHTFTWTDDQQAYAWMMRFTGHDPTDPINVSTEDSESGTTTPTSPAVTTTVDKALILRLGAFDNDNITTDAPGLSGHTAITMDTSVPGGGGAQVSYESFEEAKGISDDTSLEIATPGSTDAGDLLIAAVVTDGDTKDSLAPPGGEGWSEINKGDRSGNVTFGAWWKLADASESSSHTFSWSGNQEAYGWIMRFTGHDPSSPIHKQDKSKAKSTSPECADVTTTVENCMILRLGGFDDDDIIEDFTGLSLEGHADITMDKSSTSGGTCSGGAAYIQQESAGPSGAANFNLTGNEDYVTITVAIKPGTASSQGTVSGGAGYITQATAGSSGTSSFSLTESEQAQMVTLAIAPGAPAQSGSGGPGVTTLTAGTAYEFDTAKGKTPALAQIDATHYLCAYAGDGDDGWAVVLTVNTSDWTISKGTPFEFDTKDGATPALTQIDTGHYLCVYEGKSDDGWSTVLNVNTSTWAISQGNVFEFDTKEGKTPALIRINSDHHLCAYQSQSNDGRAIILDPNDSGLEL